MSHEERAETFAKSLLIAIRKFIDSSDLDSEEFPRWTRAANIRLAEANGSTIIFFERTPKDKDQVIKYRQVNSDVKFVFPQRTSSCQQFLFDLIGEDESGPGLSSASNLTLSISSPQQCFTNINKTENHLAFAFHNVMVQYEPEDQIEAVRYLPFALFVPSEYIKDFQIFWDTCAESLLSPIASLHGFPMADYRTEPMAKKGDSLKC